MVTVTVAGRTRRLHPCRTCREGDRQQTNTVALLPQVADLILRSIGLSLAPAHPPYPSRAGANDYFDEGKKLNTATPDMGFPLSHPGIGEVGRDADQLSGGRKPRKRDDAGRHGAPT